MKRSKSRFSLLSLAAVVLCMSTIFSVGALAMDDFSEGDKNNRNEAVLLSEEEANVDRAHSKLISETTLQIETDKNGNVINVYSADQPRPYSNTHEFGTNYTAKLKFYKSGGTYYVSLNATVDDSKWWFVKHQLKIRPKNNTKWFEHTNSYTSKPKSVSDEMYFSYPNGAPSKVTVEVKGYFSVRGPDFLDKTFRWDTVTLDNP